MIKRLIFSFLSAFLLFICWPPISSWTCFVFFAFVPLLIVELDTSNNKISQKQFFGYSYLTFFLFNLLTTYWIKHAHIGGAVFAILCNALFMALVFSLFSIIKNNIKSKKTFFILPILWLGFEFLHLNWDLSWPWLTLGNVFAIHSHWVQWYSYTGVLGGSLWVLLVNISIIHIYEKTHKSGFRFKFLLSTFILLSIPLLSSNYLYMKYFHFLEPNSNSMDRINLLVVQPNIDPYMDKFSISQTNQTNDMLSLINPHVNENIDFIILPETFLAQPIWEHQFFNNLDIKKLFDLINSYKIKAKSSNESVTTYPLNIFVGATTLALSENSPTSKPLGSHKNQFYKVYNTALHLRKNSIKVYDKVYQNQDLLITTYHKSKLVPGAEKMPFQDFLFPILGDQILKIGSATSLGNFSSQDSLSVFKSVAFPSDSISKHTEYSIAPIICYESIYGDYVRRFVQKGAQAIFIITNDGWWKQTSGYKQHSMYAKLRAIETRCYIARSANTGISSIINPLGVIDHQIDWDKSGVISASILLNNNETFYTKHGDFLGRIASFLSISIFLLFLVRKKLKFSH